VLYKIASVGHKIELYREVIKYFSNYNQEYLKVVDGAFYAATNQKQPKFRTIKALI